MKLSGLIAALVATGGTLEQVQALVQAAEAQEEARRAARREGDAERQRRCRAGRLSRVTGRDACDTPAPSSFPPDPLTNNPLPLKTHTNTASAGSRIDRDWQPGAEGTAYAADQELQPAEIEAEVMAFRDHWLRLGEPQADWHAAWRGWVRNGLSRRKPSGTRARASPPADEPKIELPIGRISERLVRETWASGRWPKSWGPRRGETGCRVPERVFQSAC